MVEEGGNQTHLFSQANREANPKTFQVG